MNQPVVNRIKLKGGLRRRAGPAGHLPAQSAPIRPRFCAGNADDVEEAVDRLLPPADPRRAGAADITGVPKIREADQVQIGTTRIRLGGIDAPSVDQLCLNTKGERWTCGVAARDELIKHVGNKSWTCQTRSIDRRGRTVARCQVDGEDIQKWLVTNGWALAFVRITKDYEADEKVAREAKAGMWQGAFIAPWDWRVRNKKTQCSVR